ncbi:MAG TPA: NAD(P)-dependent oxidoreductase [Candidatus Omnitrophota bacterium]|nr:NAD(P)-dependent oxidoreductase [Candidatus Omnitrophota bacterium]
MADLTPLVITTTGLVGSTLARVLHASGARPEDTYYPAVDTPRGIPVDITSGQSVRSLFEKTRPKTVILSAALTNVEYCQENRDAAYEVNVKGARNVAEACLAFGAKLVFFSSDYVFDGHDGPYSETDVPHPLSVYGETKLAGESLIRDMLADYLIIRTTVVYGYEQMGKNFCYRLINTLKERRRINVPRDQVGTPTYAYNLAQIVADLIDKKRTGIYNVVGRDLVDRYEFSKRVCEVFGLDASLLNAVTTEELRQKAPRPLRAGLRTDKVRRDSSISVMGVDEGLKAFKRELDGKAS